MMNTESKSNQERLVRVFISYSHQNKREKDELAGFLQRAGNHFEILSDDLLKAGDEWKTVLPRIRDEAEIFLLLVSNAYLNSKTINEMELPHILSRGSISGIYIIPVILEPCNWQNSSIAGFQALPKFGKPLNEADDRMVAMEDITNELISLYYLLSNKNALEIISRCRQTMDTELNLSGCHLYHIPRELLNMDWLKQLYLQNNSLRKIENLENLKNLLHLDLSNNDISVVENLQGLENLEYLDLERNRIAELTNLEHNKKLRTLGVSTNQIQNISGISELGNLTTLYCSRNRIEDIGALSGLKNLNRVVLSDNRIISVRPFASLIEKGINVAMRYALKPEELGIFVKGNPISDPPIEVIERGREAILDHFDKTMRHGEKKLEVLKLILVGNSGVGKTNLRQFLLKQPLNSEHISTDSLEIEPWIVPFLRSEQGDPMHINIFDFGGQDYYHDLHKLYYSHDTAYVLMWETSSNFYSERKEKLPDNTELIYEDYPIEYWLESIRYHLYGKEPPGFGTEQMNKPIQPIQQLAGTDPVNPVEQKTEIDTDLSKTAPVLVLQNKIEEVEGLLNQVWLRENYPNIATFYNLSLKHNIRLNSLEDVLEACLTKLNLSGRKLVTYQHEIIEKYLNRNFDFEVLSLQDFEQKCIELVPEVKSIIDINDVKTIANILTNLGVIFFDPTPVDSQEDGIVFTRIDELNNLIRQVMNVAKLGSSKGMFHYDQVKQIKHIDQLLPLLIRNKSVIPLADQNYLVPQFLPVSADPGVAGFTQAFVHCHIRYIYRAYFHKSLLISLYAKFLTLQNENNATGKIKIIHYWRNGLIVSAENAGSSQLVFLNFVKERTSCRIEIRTLYPFGRTGLERDIEKELDQLNKGWTCAKEVSVNSIDYFEVTAMIDQVKEKKQYSFQGLNKSFTVNDFKHLVNFTTVPKKLFISYSSKNGEFIKRFWTHLDVLRSAGYIEPWFDRKIEAGTKWDDSIRREMASSDLVIFLLSPDFLATPYIMNEELKYAMEMEEKKQCELFFIQLLHSSWLETELKKYQMLHDPRLAEKAELFIGSPTNDEAWTIIQKILRDKIAVKI